VSEASKSGWRHFDVALLTNHAEGMSIRTCHICKSEGCAEFPCLGVTSEARCGARGVIIGGKSGHIWTVLSRARLGHPKRRFHAGNGMHIMSEAD